MQETSGGIMSQCQIYGQIQSLQVTLVMTGQGRKE